jgi:D-aspartate ligase
MNMFYTGLGIARSLGERGIPVIGLSATRGVYGNYTRYAAIRSCPDSREQPEELLRFLLQLGAGLPVRALIFPTRDDDVLFLDRYREPLKSSFDLVLASAEAVKAALDKWETYLAARRAGVESPRCWLVRDEEELGRAAAEVAYPCVVKPLSSHLWRQHNNWERVGGRKAIAIESQPELEAEYAQIATADSRVLVQELVPGPDDQLFVAACYLNQAGQLVAGFTARKLLQYPEGFGTGCIVETVDRPELLELAARLLGSMGLTGIAEVEFKWDAACRRFKLIEVNPRPWDQHPLGRAAGVDLMYLAYCERAALPLPRMGSGEPGYKWVGEDACATTVLRMIWKRDSRLRSLPSLARGKRVYAIWSGRDPKPFLFYMTKFLPQLMWLALRQIAAALGRCFRPLLGRDRKGAGLPEVGGPQEGRLQDAKTKG